MNNHSDFQLIRARGLFDRGWNSWFSIYYTKLIAQFLPRLGLASYFCCLLLCSFLTTKMHPSDVEPSYIPTFRLIQSAVYPVGVSKDCSNFVQMIDYNFKELVQILTKINTNICLLMPYKCTKFQPDQSTHLRGRADLYEKTKKKMKNKNWSFGLSYLGNAWHDLLQFWNPASPYRRAVSQQIWWFSGKRARIYGCMKIATLLFLLLYSLPFALAPGLLGHTTHYRVSWSMSRIT